MRLKVTCWVMTLFMLVRVGAAAAFEEQFDSLDKKRWQVFTQTPAQFVHTNSLSATGRAAVLQPRQGQDYIISKDVFVNGSFTLDFKHVIPARGNLIYYVGFHDSEPWVSNLDWLMIHNERMTFVSRRNNGAWFEKPLGSISRTPDAWHRLQFKNNGTALRIILDGRLLYTYTGEHLKIKNPMPFFAGANTMKDTPGKATLSLDYLLIEQGDKEGGSDLRNASEAELKVLHGFKGEGTVSRRGDSIALSKNGKTYAVNFSHGLQWESMSVSQQPLMGRTSSKPVFQIGNGKNTQFSYDFLLRKLRQQESELIVDLSSPELGVNARLSMSICDDGELRAHLEVQNGALQPQKVQVLFPIVGNLEFGGQLQTIEYFYPKRSGLLGSVTGKLAGEYNNSAWMQVMFAFDRELNYGLYVFPRDSQGQSKGLSIVKRDPKEDYVVNHAEIVNNLEMPNLRFLEQGAGVSMAYWYYRRELAAGQWQAFPTATLEAYRGGWREALAAYSGYVRSWYRPIDVPQWFRDCYRIINRHPDSFYSEKEKKYVGTQNNIGGEDLTQWAFWEDYEDKSKDASLSQMGQYQQGEYHYNKARGGKEAFAEEIRRSQESGVPVALYMNHRFCWKDTPTGQKFGPLWGAMSSPGKYYSYAYEGDLYSMCFYDKDKWPSFMRDTCVRLVRDLNVDAVYLDELSFNLSCYNPKHDHFKKGNYPTDPQALAQNLKMVRDSIHEVRSDTVLWTEHVGSDYLTQFFDASWDQTNYKVPFGFVTEHYDDNFLMYFRFLFPEFKIIGWGPSVRQMERTFFNGVGMDLGGASDQEFARTLGQVLKENSDAIQTPKPEPLVPTSHQDLLANRFDTPDKLVFTLYNRGEKPVTGMVLERVPANYHVVSLVQDAMLPEGKICLEPKFVAAIAYFQTLIEVKIVGAQLHISAPAAADYKLYAYREHDVEWKTPDCKTQVRLVQGRGSMPVEDSKIIILKLFKGKYLVDEVIIKK